MSDVSWQDMADLLKYLESISVSLASLAERADGRDRFPPTYVYRTEVRTEGTRETDTKLSELGLVGWRVINVIENTAGTRYLLERRAED